MKIIVVESELYLAQSIASKLVGENFDVEIYSSIKDGMESNGEIYLLSSSISGQSCIPLVRKFKNKIIIMMVNYINNDTVGEPMKYGAHDYIVKPFMIEDLIRKINHHRQVCILERNNEFYEEYMDKLLEPIEYSYCLDKISLPVVVHTNYLRVADKFALEISQENGFPLSYISLKEKGWSEKISKIGSEIIAYIIHLEKLKKRDRKKLFDLLGDKMFFLVTTEEILDVPFEVIKIETKNKLYDPNEILTIDEYVQYVVKNFQYKFPDTELSKKLGISRKSLWEKRKKYDLFKKK